MNDGERRRLTDDEEDRESYRINAVNPSQIELRLALEPGGPESLDEAVERVLNGEAPPVLPEPEDR